MDMQIRHVVQYRRKVEPGKDNPNRWYDDDHFYSGWFNHNATWSDEPSDTLKAQVRAKYDEIDRLEYRILTDIRGFSRKVST